MVDLTKIGSYIKQFDGKSYLLWIFNKVVFPLFPILICYMVEKIFNFGTFNFPDENIIVYSFLLPIIYLQEFQNANTRNFLYIASVICMLLYGLSIVAKQPHIMTKYPTALPNTYYAGMIAFYLEISFAVIFEFIRACQLKKE